jgi:transcriptional regulator with XRE-family HTH domain
MNKLREVRVVKRISQFRLGLDTGIHQSKISLIENGLVEPREDERKRLAKALKVKVEEIWGAENESTKII